MTDVAIRSTIVRTRAPLRAGERIRRLIVRFGCAICLATRRQLEIAEFLQDVGLTRSDIRFAAAALVSGKQDTAARLSSPVQRQHRRDSAA
jgi:hypothetical protein